MKSSNRWLLEVMIVAVAMLALGQVVTSATSVLVPDHELNKLEQVLITLYLLLVGLVIEVIRWAQDALQGATKDLQEVIDRRLNESTERATRTAIIRSMFSIGNVDTVSAEIHFANVDAFLTDISRLPPLIQRATGVLAERHLNQVSTQIDHLVEPAGVSVRMDESARMTSVMAQDCMSYVAIERAPCDPNSGWSQGYLKALESMSHIESLKQKFILLCDPDTMFGTKGPDGTNAALALFALEADYLCKHGFEVSLCDVRRVEQEVGTLRYGNHNFEVFDDRVALIMDEAEVYRDELTVRLEALAGTSDVGRSLKVIETFAVPVTPRRLKAGRLP